MQYNDILVADANDIERGEFFRKTYIHLAFAVLAFIGVEILLLDMVPEHYIMMLFEYKYAWLLVLGIFWLGSTLSSKWSLSLDRNTQYFGLGFFVFLEALIFLPMIYIAVNFVGVEVIYQAAMLTISLFAGLSGVAISSKIDFSFLRTFIIIGGFISLGLIAAGILFGFNLGLWFSVGMVVLASAGILYETNKLRHTYTTGQYVGAALQLFSSIMLLFWYILRILMSRRD